MNIDLGSLVVYGVFTIIVVLVILQIRDKSTKQRGHTPKQQSTTLNTEVTELHTSTPHVSINQRRPFLSGRELEVAQLIAQGYTNKEVAHQLDLSPHTIGTHLKKVYRKLDVSSRAELTRALQDIPGQDS